MPLEKLPLVGLETPNQRRRLPETINKILDHGFDDSKRESQAERDADVTPVNKAYDPGHLLRYTDRAIDDNVTDAWPAFQAMANVGGKLVVPAPRLGYRLSRPVVFPGGKPVDLVGSGYGYTPGGSLRGCVVRLDSGDIAVAAFSFPAFVQGVSISGIHFLLSRTGLNHRAISIAAALQGRVSMCRCEGSSTEDDDQYFIELLDPTAIVEPYTGAFDIVNNYVTNVLYGVVLRPNCTTVRIMGNEFYGNVRLASPPNTLLSQSAVVIENGVIGALVLGNTAQGWKEGVVDEGNSNATVFNYFETNATCDLDTSGSVGAVAIGNRRIDGGTITQVFDNTTDTIRIDARNFHVDNAFAEFGLGFRERLRGFNLGDPQSYVATYTGNGSQTFTGITVTTLKYALSGSTLTVWFMIDGTAGGTPNTELRIALPTGATAAGRARSVVQTFNNLTQQAAVAEVQNGDAFIRFYHDMIPTGAATNWTAGGVAMYGVFSFEVAGV